MFVLICVESSTFEQCTRSSRSTIAPNNQHLDNKSSIRNKCAFTCCVCNTCLSFVYVLLFSLHPFLPFFYASILCLSLSFFCSIYRTLTLCRIPAIFPYLFLSLDTAAKFRSPSKHTSMFARTAVINCIHSNMFHSLEHFTLLWICCVQMV